MMRDMKPKGSQFTRLTEIMARLRSKDGCPWDREQTMNDVKVCLIDEAYEVLEAIDTGNRKLLCEELGDLLFQIVFIAHLAEEEGAFDMDEIIREIEEKMTRRHPHVFGEAEVSGAQGVLRQWETIKAQEGKSPRTSLLSGVSEDLPALYRAYRMGLRAARVGFDWENKEELLRKVREEIREFEEALSTGDGHGADEELGDLLFALANLARHLDREPEGLLRRANAKFEKRFRRMEEMARQRGTGLEGLSMEALDRLWEEAKDQER